MPAPPAPSPPRDPEQADFTALRYLAVILAGMIAATWLTLDDVAIQLLMTGLLVGILVVALAAVHLRRRWRRRD